MNRNSIIATAVSVIAIFLFLIVVYNATNQNSQKIYPETGVVKGAYHHKWSSDKKIVLTEYADFQCPACREFHKLLQAEFEASKSPNIDITKRITFVYRYFPLTQHKNSFKAAYTAEAAGKQNKFFPMADILFDKQDDWAELDNPTDKYLEYAKSLHLDIDQFTKDIDSKAVKDRVAADLQAGGAADVNQTPTFFLNGRKMDFTSADDFAEQLKKAK